MTHGVAATSDSGENRSIRASRALAEQEQRTEGTYCTTHFYSKTHDPKTV